MMTHKHIRVVMATAAFCCVTACGSTGAENTGQSTPSSFAGFPGMPGAFGEIASVSGTTITVTSPTAGEVSVTYTDTTEFTDQVAASPDTLTTGSCVQVTAEGDADPVVATTVLISQPVDNSCGIAGGGDGTPPPGATPPSGAAPPSGMPSGGMPSGGAGGFGATTGQVTAVGDGGFTITATTPGAGGAQTIQVSTAADTTWLSTTDADATALAAGRCVLATGETDGSGAVKATQIAISDPIDGNCAGGSGRP
jgi:hypothetical protein